MIRRFRLAWLVLALPLAVAGAVAVPGSPRGQLLDRQKEALRILRRGLEAQGAEAAGLLKDAARRMDELAAETALVPAPLREELTHAASGLRGQAEAPSAGFSGQASLRLLERLGALLGDQPLGLSFEGSYSQTKIKEPAYGGHASSMGPPPLPAPSAGGGGPSPVQFQEVGGLGERTYCGGRTKDHLLESGGSGIALVDYDNDGLLDIYAVSAFELDDQRRPIPHKNALYHNLGGWKFENVAEKAGVAAAAWGNGVCAGDFNNDGLVDLYVTNWGSNFLYKNNGNGTFTEVAASAGVQAGGWSTGCAFFDADGDGNLDLYVARYATVSWDEVEKAQRTQMWRGLAKVMVGPVGLPGAADLFYKNRGDGTFVDATAKSGLTDAAGSFGFGVVATDFDNDGWTDLFVANDSGPNFLYHNRGDGTFESVGLIAGVAVNAEGRAQAGMGIDAGDYDNDGLMDFALTTFAHDSKTLYHNQGGGLFEDVSQAAGIAAPTFVPMGWGVAFLDADLDGKLDLFLANGHIYPQVDDFPELKESYRQRNQFFLNESGVFRDVSESAGLQGRRSYRGLAVGDLDNDGDPDLVLSSMDEAPTLLENRQRTGHHWVGFQLRKTGRNRLCVGARVVVKAGGLRQIRDVRSGGGYLSQNDFRTLFGLGSHSGPVDVEVRLGQERWRFQGLPVDRYTTLDLREVDRLQN